MRRGQLLASRLEREAQRKPVLAAVAARSVKMTPAMTLSFGSGIWAARVRQRNRTHLPMFGADRLSNRHHEPKVPAA